MLNINLVEKLLENSKPLEFEKIWSKVKDDLLKDLQKTKDEEIKVKNDLLLSMIQDEKLIMIGNNTWSLRNKYSTAQQEKINSSILGSEDDVYSDIEALKADIEKEEELEDEEDLIGDE